MPPRSHTRAWLPRFPATVFFLSSNFCAESLFADKGMSLHRTALNKNIVSFVLGQKHVSVAQVQR